MIKTIWWHGVLFLSTQISEPHHKEHVDVGAADAERRVEGVDVRALEPVGHDREHVHRQVHVLQRRARARKVAPTPRLCEQEQRQEGGGAPRRVDVPAVVRALQRLRCQDGQRRRLVRKAHELSPRRPAAVASKFGSGRSSRAAQSGRDKFEKGPISFCVDDEIHLERPPEAAGGPAAPYNIAAPTTAR